MCFYESLHTHLSAHMHSDRLMYMMTEYFIPGKLIYAWSHAWIQTTEHQPLANLIYQPNKLSHEQIILSRLCLVVCVRVCVCVFLYVSFFHPLISAFHSCLVGDFLPVSPSAHFTIYFFLFFPWSSVHYTSNLTSTPQPHISLPPAEQISVLEKLIFNSFLHSIPSIIQTVTCWTFNEAHFSICLHIQGHCCISTACRTDIN